MSCGDRNALRRLAWLAALLLIATTARAEDESAPPGAAEGELLERGGVIYEVREGKLVPLADIPAPPGEEGAPAADEPRAPVQLGEDVTVTASYLDTDVASATVRSQVIDADTLKERGARTLADALRDESGIQINSAQGVNQEVYIDGLDGKYVLVLVDGRPINGRVNNRIDMSRLPVPASSIERIEVVRGPMSALYGSEALGGVINIVTRRAQPGWSAEISLDSAITSDGVTQASSAGSAGGSGGGLTGRLGYSLMRGFSYDRAGRSAAGEVIRSPDGKSDVPDRRQASLQGEVSYLLGTHWLMRATLLALDSEAEARVAAGAPFADANRNRQLQTGLAIDGDVVDGHRLVFDARADAFSHRAAKLPTGGRAGVGAFCSDRRGYLAPYVGSQCAFDRQLSSDASEQGLRFEGRYEGQILDGDPVADKLSVSAGLVGAWQHDTRVDGTGRDTLPGGKDRLLGSLYAEMLYRPFRFLTLLPGVRAEVFAPSGKQRFGLALAPKMSGRLDLPLGFALRASYGEGFRLPSFQERFLVFDHSELGYIVLGNPDLLPERSRGMRAEALWEWTPRLSFGVEGFLNLLDNLITETGGTEVNESGIPIFTYGNVARAYTAGVNLNARAQAFLGFSIDVSYQYLYNAVDASRCPPANPYFCAASQGAVSLPLRSPHALRIRLRQQIAASGTSLFAQMSVLDARPLGQGDSAPAYANLSCGVRQVLLDHVEAVLTFDNMLDYYDPIFGPKPGRNVMLSFRAFM